jgi:hypothetical protein
MSYRKNILERIIAVSLLWLMVISVVGCNSSKTNSTAVRLGRLTDPRLDNVMRKSIAAMGNNIPRKEQLQIIGPSIATIFEPDGSKTLVAQRHQVVIRENNVITSVISKEPLGVLREQLSNNNDIKIENFIDGKAQQQQDVEEVQGAALKLFLESIAFAGAVSLLNDNMELRYLDQEDKGGRLHYKIEVSGKLLSDGTKKDSPPIADLLVVWIDAESYLIDRLWVRYSQSPATSGFGYLTATICDYKKVTVSPASEDAKALSLQLPSRIEIAPSNQYQQLSERNILVLEFRCFQAELSPTKNLIEKMGILADKSNKKD